MAEVCVTTTFSADETVYAGTPLVLDTWLNLGEIDLTSAVVTLYDYDIEIIIGPGEGPLGPG